MPPPVMWAATRVPGMAKAAANSERYERWGARRASSRDLVADGRLAVVDGEQFAGQAVAVGVGAAGGEADADVADGHRVRVRELCGGCDADDGADGVVAAGSVGVGHEGGFAADDGDAGVAAGRGHALDQGSQDGRIQAVGGDVVEEGDGAGVLDGHVVEAMVDQVAAGVGRAAHFDSQVELGADAVDAGDDGRDRECPPGSG